MPEYDVTFDPQYIRRQFEKAVGRSVVKVLTEPVTNSDDSYQRLESHGLSAQPKFGEMVIELDRTKRAFAIIDQAEGMTGEQMHERFVSYGRQSADRAAGIRTRSLFGKGLRDVLFTQEESLVRSIRDGKSYICKFRLRSSSGQSKPVIEIQNGPRVTDFLRSAWGIAANGTRVQFKLNKDMSLPQSDRLEADLERFYMLRPMLSRLDRSVALRIVGRTGVEDRQLRYVPPAAASTTSVGSDAWQMEWDGYSIGVSVDLNAFEDELVQGERGLEEREGGLLVLDEDEAALDLTLFGYDKDPGAARFFGTLRLDGVGQLIRERLAADRPEEILSETRDGFNTSHAFYRAIQDRLYGWLTPHVERERGRRAGEPTNLSGTARRRHAEAFEQLNKLYRRLLGETAGIGSGIDSKPLTTDKALKFRWRNLMLQVGAPSTAQLLVNTGLVEPGSGIAIASDVPGVVHPLVDEVFVPEPADGNPTVVVGIRLEGVKVGDAMISASNADASSKLACAVLEEAVPDLPSGIIFVPDLVTVPDGERTRLSLYADLRAIETDAPAVVTSDNDHVEVIDPAPAWQAVTAFVVRADVRVRGSGKGEEAILTAATGSNKAEAYVRVVSKKDRPKAGGHFRGYEFQPLDRQLPAMIDSRGIVVVNLAEPTNEMYFGVDAAAAVKAVEKHPASATLLAELILGVCLQAAVSEAYQRGKLKVRFPRDPATDIAVHIAEQRYSLGSAIHRLFVPRVDGRG
jgi:hypothetical protein